MISDEVWVRLDPGAGMVRRIPLGRWVLAAIAVLLAWVAWTSGAIVPRLSYEPGGHSRTWPRVDEIGRRTGATLTLAHDVANTGRLPVTVTAVGVRAESLAIDSATLPDGSTLPLTIPPGGRITLTLVLTATDCRAAISKEAPLVLDVETWWGRTTVEARRAGEYEEPWQLFLRSGCGLSPF
ncbi:hypothetical protein GBF35_05645 [Nonomuraea phyllanthi]|uniref:hypothetical protein n=1 Tax=Nonomuraea phyllanthi TaxID=2219224 RepID=UPI001293D147|nr:hypothetical protein [Nonomuraea phyllanthi]QFY06227.1 hypothetical protein GBF35_05645 [Nonomuraea phyllanthi]